LTTVAPFRADLPHGIQPESPFSNYCTCLKQAIDLCPIREF
jgi:hypothetical protein